MTVFGWDASNYDDPPRVRDGIDFYTHKAAEGHRRYYDREYKASLEAARSLGIPILGAYFVNHPGTVDDQADWFVEILDRDTPWWRTHPCFVLQIDAELFDYYSPHRQPTRAEIQAFGDRLVQRHGVDPRRVLAYAPMWLYRDSLAGLSYRLWASSYGANPAVHYRSAYPGDFSARWQAYSGQTPLLLQYGSRTTIGDQATCDANAYRGTLEELMAALGADQSQPPALRSDERMFAMKEQSSPAVWLTNLVNRRGGVTWPAIQAMHAAGLIQTPTAGVDSSGFVYVVPDGQIEMYAGPQLLEGGDGGTGDVSDADLAAAVDEIKAEIRDAAADLGEGGATQVRADEDA